MARLRGTIDLGLRYRGWRLDMYYCYFETPIGELLLAGDGDGLAMIGFPAGLDASRSGARLDLQ